jgi:uracil-DNA glycosylase
VSDRDGSRIARIESWLRYADELRLGPYYLNRVSQSVRQPPTPESNARAVGAAAGSSFEGSTPVSRVASQAESAARVAAPPAIESTPRQRPAPVAPSISLPVSAGPSLFDERIEGDSLERVLKDIGPDCTRCKLHKARKQIVFGVGNPKAQLVFVGEGPGRDEDEQGEPFVGRAGKLLTQMIEAMGLRREDVYICNVVKCRPPENRLPERDEITTCSPYLLRQLSVIGPKVICCLGSCSAQTLLQTNQGISRFRGQWFDFQGSKLIATYHPAYLLRNPEAKGEVWRDLQKVMAVLGLAPKRR